MTCKSDFAFGLSGSEWLVTAVIVAVVVVMFCSMVSYLNQGIGKR